MTSIAERFETPEMAEDFPPPVKPPIRRDVRAAAAGLGLREIRYLVDLYYQMQEYRKSAANQTRSLGVSGEPASLLGWITETNGQIEDTIAKTMDEYTKREPTGMGGWAREVYGIGPIISAGLLAHIDITRAKTAGAIWRFGGLDPTLKWGKGEKRPYNASLKVLCWKIGDSFVKFHNRDECFYGKLYEQRKAMEVKRNEDGGNADAAARQLQEKHIRDTKTRAILESGKLPDGQIDARARRWTVKLFLAHWFEEAYRKHYGTEPPAPYPIAHLGHAHRIESPHASHLG